MGGLCSIIIVWIVLVVLARSMAQLGTVLYNIGKYTCVERRTFLSFRRTHHFLYEFFLTLPLSYHNYDHYDHYAHYDCGTSHFVTLLPGIYYNSF